MKRARRLKAALAAKGGDVRQDGYRARMALIHALGMTPEDAEVAALQIALDQARDTLVGIEALEEVVQRASIYSVS